MRLGRRPGLVATRSGVDRADRADRVGQPGRLAPGLHGTFTRHKGELNPGTPMLIPYRGRVRKGGWAMTHKELFSVEGLMCGTCLVEVLERLHDLDGVVEVGISLRARGGPERRAGRSGGARHSGDGGWLHGDRSQLEHSAGRTGSTGGTGRP